MEHRLARHAGDVGALTTDTEYLHDRDRTSNSCDGWSDDFADRSPTEHYHVEMPRAHHLILQSAALVSAPTRTSGPTDALTQ
jgi:hypothetical protein